MKSNQTHHKRQIIPYIFIGIIVITLSIVAMVMLNKPNSQDIDNLPEGVSAKFTQADIDGCIPYLVDPAFTCNVLNAGEHYQPGLYTVVYTPDPQSNISTTDPTGLGFELKLENYLTKREKKNHSFFYYFDNVEKEMIIENVPLHDDSYIEFNGMLDNDYNFTFELIPQDQYIPYQDNRIGFYPVDIAISQGTYKLNDSGINEVRGDIVTVKRTKSDSGDFIDNMITDGEEFSLNEFEIYVSYNSQNELAVLT